MYKFLATQLPNCSLWYEKHTQFMVWTQKCILKFCQRNKDITYLL